MTTRVGAVALQFLVWKFHFLGWDRAFGAIIARGNVCPPTVDTFGLQLTVLGRVVFMSATAAALDIYRTDVAFVSKEVTVIAHQGPRSV